MLDTDASSHGLGAVLSQIQSRQEVVIAYYSRTLSRSEMNYCTTRKELLAVVQAVKHFHPYLYGRKFRIRSDHASLQWILHFKPPEGQLARWMEILQMYDFIIEHRSGQKHGNADALSRRPCMPDCNFCGRQEAREVDQLQGRQRSSNLDSAATKETLKTLRVQTARSTSEGDNIPEGDMGGGGEAVGWTSH